MKKAFKSLTSYFSKTEITLWCVSVALILVSYCVFHNGGPLKLAASLIGVTSLIFNAKGNPIGQILIIIFSVLYGIISLQCAYYGEMITYLGMSAPMAVCSFVSWIRNPYKGNKAQVKINKIKRNDVIYMVCLTVIVTAVFYFILSALNTANIVPSTISVATSFAAVYLTFRRSAYYALAYAANDIVLIVLWVMIALNDISYFSVIICFVVFLVNDLYAFINWQRMQKRQQNGL